MMNWAEYEEKERKHERSHTRRIIVAVLVGGLVAAGLIGFAKKASAEPRFVAGDTASGVVITLHDAPCTLEAVTNLPYRATWQEAGKTFEGCWAARPDLGAVMAYFDDKTVAAIPFQVLKPAQGA